jgi:hypothetical protein
MRQIAESALSIVKAAEATNDDRLTRQIGRRAGKAKPAKVEAAKLRRGREP